VRDRWSRVGYRDYVKLAIANTCAKTEIAATQSWQILDYLLLHISKGASVDWKNLPLTFCPCHADIDMQASDCNSERILTAKCRWGFSIQLEFSKFSLQMLCCNLAETLIAKSLPAEEFPGGGVPRSIRVERRKEMLTTTLSVLMRLPSARATQAAHAIIANTRIFGPFQIVAAVLPQVLEKERQKTKLPEQHNLQILAAEVAGCFNQDCAAGSRTGGGGVALDANELANVLQMLFDFDRRSHVESILKDTRIAALTVMLPALCELLRTHEQRAITHVGQKNTLLKTDTKPRKRHSYVDVHKIAYELSAFISIVRLFMCKRASCL